MNNVLLESWDRASVHHLETEIKYHRSCYYSNVPVISDEEFDTLKKTLNEKKREPSISHIEAVRTFTLTKLRDKNIGRLKDFGHSSINVWSETDWACAAAGEMGELCNFIKKRRRGDIIDIQDVSDEIADVVIYLDLLAARVGVNLEEAIVKKFNEVSDKVESDQKL